METSRVSILLLIPEISKSNVKMLHPERVCDKLKKMSEGGKECLQLVTDFDRTLSKFVVDKSTQKTLGSVSFFGGLSVIPESFKKEFLVIISNYVKLERGSNMKFEERLKLTDELMIKLKEALRSVPMESSSLIQEEVSGCSHLAPIRDGLNKMLQILNDEAVPVTILSGGIGDVIQVLLKTNDILYDNIRILSNFLTFKNGYIEGYTDDPVHMYNKNKHFLKNNDKEFEKRNNIILLGDSLTDAYMADGVPDTCNVFKIALYNEASFGSLETFMEKFDIVIVDGETVDVVTSILTYIL